ncbi:MAG: adenylyl-sulfate kinase [Magnetococcales bacterium]|nr:adenylyl-sulfate kinase [Magnetococcales bacterium]
MESRQGAAGKDDNSAGKGARILWFTGLSGSGKSTLANGLITRLEQSGARVKRLDGDELRAHYDDPLSFTPEDIRKNNRRVVELCQTLSGDYDYLVVAVITPYRDSRAYTREVLGERYCEIYVKAHIDTVIARDVKGLYAKAVRGEIDNFIGISPNTPYEEPVAPDLVIDTDTLTPDKAERQLLAFVSG